MSRKDSKKKKGKKVADAPEKSATTSSEPEKTASSLVFAEQVDVDFCTKWPIPKLNVPEIFLHNPIDFAKHVRKLLSMEISFYHPIKGRYYTKIACPTFEDQKAIIQYFDSKELPYHTFGHPSKRKMKVVIRGLQNDINLDELKSELKQGSIPVVRVHRMRRHKDLKDKKPLILVVVPNNEEGRKLILLKQIFGFDVQLEPAKIKTKQCYRCQMWGHSQRYCHGVIKCVKCAGNHLTKRCDMDPNSEPKCANCGHTGHVASWRKCSHCPDSPTHKMTVDRKKRTRKQLRSRPVLVTIKTCNTLYKNVKYD